MNVRKYQCVKKKTNYILQPSIKNLLLINNHKFDLRMFVVVHQNTFKLFAYGFAGVCKQKYSSSSNKEIHLTNLENNYDNTEFDETFENYPLMINKMTDVVRKLEKIYDGYFTKKYSVVLLGLDFIFNKDYDAYLLEINYYPYYHETKYKDLLCTHLLNDVYEPLLNKQPMFQNKVWL